MKSESQNSWGSKEPLGIIWNHCHPTYLHLLQFEVTFLLTADHYFL